MIVRWSVCGSRYTSGCSCRRKRCRLGDPWMAAGHSAAFSGIPAAVAYDERVPPTKQPLTDFRVFDLLNQANGDAGAVEITRSLAVGEYGINAAEHFLQ